MLRSATPATIGAIGNKIERCCSNKSEVYFVESLDGFERSAHKLLSDAFWNTEETLTKRRDEIVSGIQEAKTTLLREENWFNDCSNKVAQHQKILEQALTHGVELEAKTDENGTVTDIRIVHKKT